MKRELSRMLSVALLLTISCVFTACPSDPEPEKNITQDENNKGGNQGNNQNENQGEGTNSSITYSYDENTKELIISGLGRMDDYTTTNQPWHDFDIEKVTIKDGCTYIGAHAFHNLKNTLYVSDIPLPNSVKEIGNQAFSGTAICELSLPKSIVKIGYGAFSDCEYLIEAKFSGCDNLEEIDDYAFKSCPIDLGNFILPKNVRKVGDEAFSSSTITKLTLNDGLETVGLNAFSELKQSQLVIPNSVKSIGHLAFHGSFTEIRVGTGLTTLGGIPFLGANKGSLYMNQSKPLSLSKDFIINKEGNNAASSWTLYVPKGSKSAYQNATGWKSFKSIVEDSSLEGSTSGSEGDDNQGNNGDNNGNGDNQGNNSQTGTITVETGDATNTGEGTATISGKVSGVSGLVEVGILYDWTSNPKLTLPNTDRQEAVSTVSKSTFSVSLTDLYGNTTYSYRAYAIVNDEYYYGEIKTFKTIPKSHNSSFVYNGVEYNMILVEGYEGGDFYIMDKEIPGTALDQKNSKGWRDGIITYAEEAKFIGNLAYATGMPLRLPSLGEWQYAAHGGNKSKGFKYSGSDDINEVAWYKGNSDHEPQESGLKKPNELGIYDMSGNWAEGVQRFNSSLGGANYWTYYICGGSCDSPASDCLVTSNKIRINIYNWHDCWHIYDTTQDYGHVGIRLVYTKGL